MLSFISLHKENWRSHSYAAARCVGDQVLFQMLKANSNIDTVCLCIDKAVVKDEKDRAGYSERYPCANHGANADAEAGRLSGRDLRIA